MFRGLFVTGTDTGVGKTVVAAALMHRYRQQGNLKYWKPIQTGIEEDDDTAAVQQWGGCSEGELFRSGVRLPRPVAPYLAAALAGTHISISEVIRSAEKEPASVRWIAEGAGGVLVPVNESDLMIDLMVRLAMPVLIAARSSLGTINHTLLTLEALRRRNLEVAGVVLVGDKDPDNRDAIERFGHVEVLGEMPPLSPLTSESIGRWSTSALDVKGQLVRHFQ
jgi:dethiobiotin synthetase